IQRAKRSMEKLQNLAKDVNKFLYRESNVENKNVKYHHCKLKESIELAIRFIKHQMNYDVEIELDMQTALNVCGQSGKLSQAFMNLLTFLTFDNEDVEQKKHSQKKLKIFTLEVNQQQTTLRIAGSDKTISPDKFSRIFQPLYTNFKPEYEIENSLVTSRQIIESYGGNIKAQPLSASKEGLHFDICLPLYNSPATHL
ncbi:MAG: HAMP domain-containing histidine kinase, partial [Bdellovibrionales bacterium]|nr:HAMP domain-containing histidine kinase [Bdellovibrionales bacterium]